MTKKTLEQTLEALQKVVDARDKEDLIRELRELKIVSYPVFREEFDRKMKRLIMELEGIVARSRKAERNATLPR